MGHEHRDFISHASEKAVDVAIDLGDFDVGVTILCDEMIRNIISIGVPKVANLVQLHGQRSWSQVSMRSPGNRSWTDGISVIPISMLK